MVAQDRDREIPSGLRELAGAGLTVVMSSAAWRDYRVPGSPYFVYVDAAGRIRGEGAATGWPQLVSLLRDALDDAALTATGRAGAAAPKRGRASAGAQRARRADEVLEAAGIGPGHPSLYPASRPHPLES